MAIELDHAADYVLAQFSGALAGVMVFGWAIRRVSGRGKLVAVLGTKERAAEAMGSRGFAWDDDGAAGVYRHWSRCAPPTDEDLTRLARVASRLTAQQEHTLTCARYEAAAYADMAAGRA